MKKEISNELGRLDREIGYIKDQLEKDSVWSLFSGPSPTILGRIKELEKSVAAIVNHLGIEIVDGPKKIVKKVAKK